MSRTHKGVNINIHDTIKLAKRDSTGLAVGLSVGLPAAVAIIGLLYLLYRSKRRFKEEAEYDVENTNYNNEDVDLSSPYCTSGNMIKEDKLEEHVNTASGSSTEIEHPPRHAHINSTRGSASENSNSNSESDNNSHSSAANCFKGVTEQESLASFAQSLAREPSVRYPNRLSARSLPLLVAEDSEPATGIQKQQRQQERDFRESSMYMYQIDEKPNTYGAGIDETGGKARESAASGTQTGPNPQLK